MSMGKALCILVLLIACIPLRAQPDARDRSDTWDRWDESVVRRLHTAAETEYLNEEEKKVILFINMARYDGALFAETFLEAYLGEKEIGSNRYVRSLFRDLNKTSGLVPLEPVRDLTAAAREHAAETGEKGRTGHGNFNRRFEPLLGNPYEGIAENLAYGHQQAIDMVLSLLIDDGIRNLGHRKNILNPNFNAAGVAIRPHRTYRTQCVIDFGAMPRSDLNEVPYQ
jgi:uncharacterized protein YkwD